MTDKYKELRLAAEQFKDFPINSQAPYIAENGAPRTLRQMMREEPQWLLSRFRYMEQRMLEVGGMLAERDALEKDANNFRELERRFREMKTSRCEQALDAFGLPLPNIEETGCFGTLADAIEAAKRQEGV